MAHSATADGAAATTNNEQGGMGMPDRGIPREWRTACRHMAVKHKIDRLELRRATALAYHAGLSLEEWQLSVDFAIILGWPVPATVSRSAIALARDPDSPVMRDMKAQMVEELRLAAGRGSG